MYTLRTFSKEGIESNTFLGNNYEFINRFVSQEAFRSIYFKTFGVNHVADLDENSTECSKDCFGFLLDEKRGLNYLSKEQKYYIVSSDGKTFSVISYKG